MSAVDVALTPIHDETAKSSAVYIVSQLGACTSESIVIYITVRGGSSMPLRVMESDSIASVKLRIQSYKGFVVKRQKLVFRGRELWRTDSLVREYGITNGDVLHLALRISDLLLISVRTTCGKELDLHVDRHRNIGYLKCRIAKKGGKAFVDDKNPEIFCCGEKLQDKRLINDISNNAKAVIHLVVQKSAKVWTKPVEKHFKLSIFADVPDFNEEKTEHEKNQCLKHRVVPPEKDFFLKPVIGNPQVELPAFLRDMVHSVSEGLAQGKHPVRSSEGMGGTYFMQDASGNKYISVFKPTDEEPLAINNPQGLPLSTTGEGLKRGTRVGEGAMKEVVAFILDYPKKGPRSISREGKIGFAGVPPTIMVQCLHKGFNHPQGFDSSEENIKTGSLQLFRKNHGSCEDMGPRDFPIEEVHKICLLDIRMANADRHGGNVLHYKDMKNNGRIVLIPIDHGYCLPEHFEDCTFEWLYWPQARETFSQDTIDYIKSLDAEQDIAILKFYGLDLSPECSQTLHVSTMLLKKGAERGLTPFAIGSMMCRKALNKKSVIEEIVDDAAKNCQTAFLKSVSDSIDAAIDKLVLK